MAVHTYRPNISLIPNWQEKTYQLDTTHSQFGRVPPYTLNLFSSASSSPYFICSYKRKCFSILLWSLISRLCCCTIDSGWCFHDFLFALNSGSLEWLNAGSIEKSHSSENYYFIYCYKVHGDCVQLLRHVIFLTVVVTCWHCWTVSIVRIISEW